MEIDAKVIAAMIAVFGLCLSALFASFGYYLRVRMESKKNAKHVLYLLLEIRRSLLTELFDPVAISSRYLTYFSKLLRDKGLDFDESQLPDEFRLLLSNFFEKILGSLCVDIESRLLEPYEKAIFELSKENPIIAHRLRTKDQILQTFDHCKKAIKDSNNILMVKSNEKPLQNHMTDRVSNLRSSVFNKFIDTLDKELLILSKICGGKEFKSCKKLTENKSREKLDNIDFSVFDRQISGFLDPLMDSLKKKPIEKITTAEIV
ncbi:hypothetical protein C9J12_11765 [Photobacterium frigidiphilum]|uniref:Uncharacterized protein n=1 Tax=Photobacterium frigidiphilum TaxID=264736 RepID=A0A2T3JH44_9GAMM|nr:hypothetical protein [Photobacterium frigidiphilum]PSU48287.1 hypothetical protein C9J12_11765 [Photobacterium frigidiphilum]